MGKKKGQEKKTTVITCLLCARGCMYIISLNLHHESGKWVSFFHFPDKSPENAQGLLLVSTGASIQIFFCWAPNPVLFLVYHAVFPASGKNKTEEMNHH